MPTSRKRSQSIKVTVTPELHERLREVAAQIGQAPATCASMAVSLWVAQQARSLDAGRNFVQDMAKQVGPELIEQIRRSFAKGEA